MRINVRKADILSALQLVSRALPKVTAIPELTYLRLRAEGQKLELSATDLRTFIATECEAGVEASGEILVPGQFFQEAVTNLPLRDDALVGLDVQANRNVHLTMQGVPGVLNKIHGRAVDEYPAVSLITPRIQVSLPASVLRQALKFGVHATAKSENTVQGYSGVRLTLTEKSVMAASQDGWRLSESTRAAGGLSVAETQNWLIPLHVVNDWMKILGDSQITVCQGDNKLQLLMQNTTYQTVLGDGNFMDYEGFFPEDLSARFVRLNRQEFLTHLRGLMPVAKEIGNRVALRVSASRLGMESYSDKLGEAYREMVVLENLLEDFSVAINAQYMMDCLNVMEAEDFCIFCEGEEMPVYFWPAGSSDDRAVIMSLTLRST